MADALHIIAEAGTTHEGNLATALRMVDIAKDAGADSVKFQLIDPPELYLTHLRENGALVENGVVAIRESQRLSASQWGEVWAHGKARGLPVSASVFDLGTLKLLDGFAPDYIKLASTDVTNDALIEASIATGRKVLLSTGMSGLGEIEHAVEVLDRAGARDVVLLHCVSLYPCPVERANMRFIETLRSAFGYPVGFSDHTETSVAAITAIALGATWIEKHITYDRTAKGFDHAYAMEPATFSAYVADLRAAEAALKPQRPKVGPQEAGVRARARRGLWTARDLPAGHVLTAHDIRAVRPAGPLTPADLPALIGRRLSTALPAATAFRPEDLD
jgi:sialic acid synthase SpsE